MKFYEQVSTMLGRLVLCSTLICVFIAKSNALNQQNLNGKWSLCDTTYKYNNLVAHIPGGIYSDLIQNGIIGDIFYGFNDVETRWVAKQTWNYTTVFTAHPDVMRNNHVKLIFEGLDTFATIYLNGKTIGNTDNMFVRYEFDITESLSPNDNILSVVFESPILKANYLFAKQSENYTVVPKCVPSGYNGECHVNHIRKMQASFSWDWGPAFPSVGIWKNVYLNGYNITYIKDVTVAVNQVDNDYNFNVITYAAGQGTGNKSIQGIITFSIRDELNTHIINSEFIVPPNNDEFTINKHFKLPQGNFNLWWPNGFGNQDLYDLKITLSINGESSTKSLRIGIRDVQLVQKPVGSGLSFHFEVNGVPIFAKGSNMVPSHILPEFSNNETLIRSILQNAKDVHMNMIRIWGGGLYEADRLYELADEMGIMIWLDFAFACSMYPSSEDFLSSVSKEIEHQVRRLQYHPSIVLWAGNNENEAALRFNWYGTISNQSIYEADYRQLYGKTIQDIVLKLDPSRTYLSSSPTNGLKTIDENLIAKNPQDNAYGDVHFYNYILDSWNMNFYPIPRFASEYGYQALPSYQSFLTTTNNESDLYIGNEFMIHRQHHPLGYSAMEFLIHLRLALPPKGNNVNYNKAFIFYSQIIQAMAMKVETEHYRQWRSYLNPAGNGLTMGALYWQLNCPWVAPTWSSVDALGKWKMLHYYAKDFFAPVIVSSHQQSDNTVDIYAISDLLYPIFNATLNVTVFGWDSFDIVIEKTRTLKIDTGSLRVTNINLNYFLTRNNNICDRNPKENCFIRLTLSNETSLLAPEHYIFPVALKLSSIQWANVKIDRVEQVTVTKFRIFISADKPATFIWLESNLDGRFSENGFMQVTPLKAIVFETIQSTTTAIVGQSLTITHLKDKMYFSGFY